MASTETTALFWHRFTETDRLEESIDRLSRRAVADWRALPVIGPDGTAEGGVTAFTALTVLSELRRRSAQSLALAVRLCNDRNDCDTRAELWWALKNFNDCIGFSGETVSQVLDICMIEPTIGGQQSALSQLSVSLCQSLVIRPSLAYRRSRSTSLTLKWIKLCTHWTKLSLKSCLFCANIEINNKLSIAVLEDITRQKWRTSFG